jgi:pyruvate dehydrogenase E2 component (dihydrolipoamide acetyltransferase)
MDVVPQVFAMPDLGEGLEEGEIVEWLVAEGDAVELNQALVEVETAKATVEIPSPFAGVVMTLHGSVGAAVPVGSPLVTFGAAGGGPSIDPTGEADEREAPRTTPPVRKLAKELGVDLASVAPTGEQGRITADDVRAAAGGAPTAARRGPTASGREPQRQAIARNLERQAAIPQVTTFRTVDCSALETMRSELGVSPLPIVIAALCRTIEPHPELNAAWVDGNLLERDQVHVGIAADTDRGLVVPVVRDAASRTIGELASEISRLAEAARSGSLSPEELTGATIAVSNTGSYGSEAGTPILSPGTSVTLAVGVIAPRALVVGGEVVARPACTLSCTFDHRGLDGATVGRALTDLVRTLTTTERLGDLPR